MKKKRPSAFTRSIGPATHPDHHLWRNGKRWWVAFTYHTELCKHRIRASLQTTDLAVARARRDELMAEIAREAGKKLSLRFPRYGSGGPQAA
ncbi:MAG: hypothetical protein ACKO4Q_14435 [Planctomycetota bacterium]